MDVFFTVSTITANGPASFMHAERKLFGITLVKGVFGQKIIIFGTLYCVYGELTNMFGAIEERYRQG